MLMSEVRAIVNQIVEDSRSRGNKLDFHDIHLMLCGDLNSLPDSGECAFHFVGRFVVLVSLNCVYKRQSFVVPLPPGGG